MTLKGFDKVRLKSGESAYIADVVKENAAFVVDIDKSDGTIETEIVEITDILEVINDND